ncbi:MAG: protein-L-isoaspartate(D-aspartate) O-methyltransferase [Elusimicrobia bacterium]|nr:protein-L-isoaspartate(D-aspartate) O-methyltransferase [Elusimicrobiota bacterium]
MIKDFKQLRKEMIENQIIIRGITNKKVIGAIAKIPREKFIDKKYYDEAYSDHPLPIEEGQTISQPYIVALMTELLSLTGDEKVLEIGTGSGYQTAILSELSDVVYSVERILTLYNKAKHIFEDLGYKNIFLFNSDGTEGLKEYAPYDRIIVTAGGENIPQPLVDQLADGGRIVIPVGDRFSQYLIVGNKTNNELKIQNYGKVVFVPLIGKYGVS